jgi:flagellar hook protein FlgE
MGILTAMNNAVAGISAQSFALENISGNIANSQTTAYKRTDTSFSDLVQSSSPNVARNTSGSVIAKSRQTISINQDAETSDTETHMAINGSGFFQVATSATDAEGTLYTRRGDFSVDRNGNLVNGSNYYLKGYPIAEDGTVSSLLTLMQVNQNTISAKATQNVNYNLNLPTAPETTYAANNPDIANADIFPYDDPTGTDTRQAIAAEIVDNKMVTATNNDTFITNSISGGSVVAYDAQGSAVNVQLRWAKFADNQWGLFYQNSTAADGDEVNNANWMMIPSGDPDAVPADTFTFTDAGKLSTGSTTINMPDGIDVNGTTLAAFDLNLDATQYADTDGTVSINALNQDGYSKGDFQSMSIADDGTVSYKYSNGQVTKEWRIPLVTFAGADYLQSMDGGAYSPTTQSGPPDPYQSGTITSSALESSNVDISEEFTKLIVTQQAFSANSKVITTSDSMMQSILNIIR